MVKEIYKMNWSDKLQAALENAESQACHHDLVEIVWMLAGFPANHPVRRHAVKLPRIQSLMRTQRVCRSEIHTLLRVVTLRNSPGVVGSVANGVHELLCAQSRVSDHSPSEGEGELTLDEA
jgi:hypothetical protein